MVEGLRLAGGVLIAVGILVMVGGLPLTPPAQSSLCVQSIVNLTPQATICPSSTSYIDSTLFTSSVSSNSGTWGGNSFTVPGLITTTAGVLKVYYVLASGVTLSAYSLKFNYGAGALNPAGNLVVGTDNYATWFGSSSIGSILTFVGQTAHFRASILDSLGTNSSFDFNFKLIAPTSPVTFVAYDVTNSPPNAATGAFLLGAVFQVSQANPPYAAIGTFTTDSTGKAVANLAPDSYTALVNAPSGYVVSLGTCNTGETLWASSGSLSFSAPSASPIAVSFIKGVPNSCTSSATITVIGPTFVSTTVVGGTTTTTTSIVSGTTYVSTIVIGGSTSTGSFVTIPSSITLTSQTCSIGTGQYTYTCLSSTRSGGGGGAKGTGSIVNFGLGTVLIIVGIALVARRGGEPEA